MQKVQKVGCGTGRNFPYLREAIGPTRRIYGVDLSAGMLRKARKLSDHNHWTNIHLTEGDAANYVAPEPLDGVLFSLSYNTMPHHLTVLRRIWKQLRPGGRLVICTIIYPMLTRIATIAGLRRLFFCCRIDVCFSQQWPECLTSPR
jgi:demethylmenaquinone methyltransferase/2-methoxy-6-polyprenyl-1,4-benzoquinol methylase